MKKCVFGMVFFIGVLLLGISCSKSLSHSDREKQEEISALEEWNDQIVIGFSQLGAEFSLSKFKYNFYERNFYRG